MIIAFGCPTSCQIEVWIHELELFVQARRNEGKTQKFGHFYLCMIFSVFN